MATLTGQTIASSYEQLLHVDTDGGGNTTTLVPVKDGDNGTTFAAQLSTTTVCIDNPIASAADQGGILRLQSDDGAVMASGHRLGVIEFAGAEDTSNTITTGARIEALCDATWSASENGADLVMYTTDGNAAQAENMRIYSDSTSGVQIQNTTTSSATEGGKLQLTADDGAALGDTHRLGVIEFNAAEDSSSTITTGARIEAIADAAWSASENGADMVFYTTDGNASQTEVMRLTADSGMTVGADGSGHDVVFYSGTSGDNFTWDASEECLIITGTDAAQSLKVADGDLVVVDKIYLYDNDGGEYLSSDGTDLTVTSGDNIILAVGSGGSAYCAGPGGTSNTAFGKDSGDALTTNGNYNAVFGEAAGGALTTGVNNVAVGYNALYRGTTESDDNVAIGYSAMSGNFTTAVVNDCIAIGSGALAGTLTADATGTTVVGTSAGAAITSGQQNTAVGFQALQTNVDGDNNTAVGYQALQDMEADTDGHGYNTAVGWIALTNLSTGTSNTVVGAHAMGSGTVTGDNNTSVGTKSLYDVTDGNNNTAIGTDAGENVAGGDRNQCFGYAAGDTITSGSNNTCIGSQADVDNGTHNNAICIGNEIASTAGQFSFGYTSNQVYNDFDTDSNWGRSSDERKKKNISDASLGLDFINDLRTVTYNWKEASEYPEEWGQFKTLDDGSKEYPEVNTDTTMHGMIAQEVKAALDKAGASGEHFAGWKERKGGEQSVSREMFVLPLIKAVQELSAKVTALENA